MDITEFVLALRRVRPFGLSGFELLLVFLLGCFLSTKFQFTLQIWIKYLIVVFLLGIIVHWMFGVRTQLNYQLGLSKCSPDFNSISGLEPC